MEYICITVVFSILFCCFVMMNGKIRGLERDVEIWKSQTDELGKELLRMKETVQITERQEQRIFDGVNNILNYDVLQARKAVKENADE